MHKMQQQEAEEEQQQQQEEEENDHTCPVDDDLMHRAANLIANAKRIVVFSGAGMSAESGISTFRDPEMGLWTSKIGLALFGTPIGWRWTPGLAWRMYLTRFRDPIARAKPNRGHYAIARLERLVAQQRNDNDDEHDHHHHHDRERVEVITQNVDGLHQRAGSEVVWELHGTVNRHVCSRNRHPHPYIVDPLTLGEQYDASEDPFFTHEWSQSPRCGVEGCGSYLRPDAVLFTESLPPSAWDPAERAISQLKAGDVMLVVGTSGVVYPAASLPEVAAQIRGVHVIEVNPEPSALTPCVGMFLQGASGQVLPRLVDLVEERMKTKDD